MKKILIISPHFPPSNLAGVHRPRLFAQHLPSFGWEPVIVTVHEKFYEENPDWNLVKLMPPQLRIEKVNAFKITRPRLLGDIGLRAFFQLYKKAKRLIKSESFDFVYISIPSFYPALLGRWLHHTTGIKYGIDYIDPWVHDFPGSDKLFSRHWFSKKLAGFLEPIAVKKASLITGVAEGYYTPVLERNPHLKLSAITGAMPYGGEIEDHKAIATLGVTPGLFDAEKNTIQMMYAGAMLPKAFKPLEAIFSAIAASIEAFTNIKFYFVGTGKTANDPFGYNIKPLAEKYGLWQTIVYEYPKRIPYLDVLRQMDVADGVFILGSTEPHYTPSKVYQAILSKKPILAVLHTESTAANVIMESKAGIVLQFNGEQEIHKIANEFFNTFKEYESFLRGFNPVEVKTVFFEQYSAKNVTGNLVSLLEKACKDY